MNNEFRSAIAMLTATNEDFGAGTTSPVAHANTRQAALSAALKFMAKSFGVTLQPITGIDARGELHLVALDGDRPPSLGCGKFGKKFAAWLNTANPRTGVSPGATITEDGGWCYLNHFSAEKMVLAYFNENSKSA